MLERISYVVLGRRTYKKFLEFIFSDDSIARGMTYDTYGPGDQGAYHAFYEGKFEVLNDPLFNWKARVR